MQRDVIKWVQSLDLSAPIQNPKRDLATGHLAAEIVARYSGTKYLDLHRLPNGAAAATKRDVWSQVYRALQQLSCTTVTQPLIDAVLQREPNAALTVLEHLYEHFTGQMLSMRGLDAVGTTEDAYVQPGNATRTARLLKVTCRNPNSFSIGAKGESSNAKALLFDPILTTSPLARANRGCSPTNVIYSAHDTAADGFDTETAAGNDSTRALQHRLALIDNSELAGGANALQAYPHYARPTASTLVHTASGSRKDVVLDRPKYTADEALQRQQNTRIVQQHTVVQRLQGETHGEALASPLRTQADTTAWATDASLSPPSPLHNEAALYAGKGATATASLTALYRGRFYRQPDAPTTTRTPKASTLSRKAKNDKREEAGARRQRGAVAASSADHITILEDTVDHNGAAAPGNPLSTPECLGSASGGGGTDGPRVVPKLPVRVYSDSLQTALARRCSQANLQERATALSREHFAKHNYAIRPALSDILADVLAAHKQLQRLFDCCVEDGNSEVLDNVLGHLLAHRDEFPPACIQACWQALGQHVDGLVALLQRNPDEYGYLMESLTFAFSREAAQVPLLHISQAVIVSGDVDDAEQEKIAATTDASLLVLSLPPTRRSTAISSGGGVGVGCAAAAAASTARCRSPLRGTASAAEGDLVSPRQRQSLSEALLTATHRAASAAAGSFHVPPVAPLSSSRQMAIIDTRDGLSVACAFSFLYRLARQLDVQTAAYVLERYMLRSAKPFLLRHGTVAVREAVARIVSATFVPAPPKDAATAEVVDSEAAAIAAAESEEAFAQFLTGTLAHTLLVSSPTAWNDNCGTASTSSGDVLQNSPAKCDVHRTHPLQLRVQRTYWLVVLHAVADYPYATDNGRAAHSDANGPLATCVRKGAMSCLLCTDADLLTIGVGLTVEYSERWLPRDMAPRGLTFDNAVTHARDLLSHVLPPLGSAGNQLSAPWWDTQTTNTWECRLMVLRLCNALLAHPLFAAAGEPSKASTEGSSDDDSAVPRSWRTIVDTAAAKCLWTFAKTPSWQLQLALGVTAKSVDQTLTPALTNTWRQLLLGIPAASLLTQLLPYDESPVRLRILRPLQLAEGIKYEAENDGRKAPQSSARQQLTLISSTKNNRAVPLQSATSALAGEPESWTLAPAMDNGDNSRDLGTRATAESALHLVWGRVLSAYAVLPLNQTWNAQGVVDAVLPPLPVSGGTAPTSSPPAALATAPALPLLVMAAALLSPPTTVTTTAPAAVSMDSPLGLSTSFADDVPVDIDEPNGAFWLEALRRAWPLFQACGASQVSMKQRAPRNVTEETSPQSGDDEEMAALSTGSTTVGSAGLGVHLEDLRTVVLSLFLRFADDAAVASAMAAAAGNGAELCGCAIRWAEELCSDAPTAVEQPQ
ncbi:CHlike domain in sperm protein [Leishmania braziliensis]|nr:CHlike domain in sperm protein [Leishmania braziliensis]